MDDNGLREFDESRKQNIYACLTTIFNRTKSLEETVNSLLPQVDKIFIFLHGYTPVNLPSFLENDRIELAYDLEWGDRGDIDKFHFVKDLEGYILVCDDDLIYPEDYAERMVNAVERHNRETLITAHGTIVFPLPIANYYMDRYCYPCLSDVFEEVQVQIGGTGVMAFHTDINFDPILVDKTPNMADIWIGIWAMQKQIPIYVEPHIGGWIKESDHIKQQDTISGKAFYNNFDMIDEINSRPNLFQSAMKKKSRLPKVTIAVVNSRMKSDPIMIKQCYDSLRNQTYPNIQIVVIENYDKLLTIGKCFNDATRRAKGKYILFVGDDDFITDDYVTTLVAKIEDTDKANIVGVSSYLTLFSINDKNEMKREPRELIPTGMWNVKWLRKNPFKEYLTKYVDTELMDKARDDGNIQLIAAHSYGYFYRAHQNQVSGFKAFAGKHAVETDDVELERVKDIKQRVGEVKNVS